jgi:hypothetical protein
MTVLPPVVSGDDGSWHNTGAGGFATNQGGPTVGDTDAANNARHAWIRFPAVYINQGQTVNSFKINLRSGSLTGVIPAMTVVGVKDVNAVAPATRAAVNAFPLTTATVAWTPAAWVVGTRYDSPELKTILQEIVNQPTWVSGSSVIILLKVPEDAFTVAGVLAFTAVDGGVPANAATASGDFVGVAVTNTHTLQYHMNRKAGTLVNGIPTRDAQGAANIWAGTDGLDIVHALNVKAGNTLAAGYKEIAGVLNQLAGTSGLEVDGAAASIP